MKGDIDSMGPLVSMRLLKPKVLFVCIGNSCRSQMAEGFLRKLAGDRFEVFSAGSRPAGAVHPLSVQAMQEAGIDISKQFSKSIYQIPQERYDAIVTMGCGDACPHLPAKQRFDWKIPDPISGICSFNEVREMIRQHVVDLLQKISIS